MLHSLIPYQQLLKVLNSNDMIVIDLPSLQSITLGGAALWGRKDDSCSLTMRSTNEMIRNE